jgi:hypothetical protein
MCFSCFIKDHLDSQEFAITTSWMSSNSPCVLLKQDLLGAELHTLSTGAHIYDLLLDKVKLPHLQGILKGEYTHLQ